MRPWLLVLLVAAACAPTADDASPDDTDLDRDSDTVLDVAACLADPTCHDVLVVAHRGFHRDVPENTLAAVTATTTLGAHLAEIDVRTTSDGALVVMHDDTVDRTTDGTGAVADLTLAEVRALVADGGTDAASARVPTFDEVLDAAVQLGLGIYVDTKTERVDLVAQAIVDAGAEHLAVVRKGFGELGPALDAGLLVIAPAGSVDELAGFADALPPAAFVEIAQATPSPELGAAIRDAGLRAQQDVFLGDAPWTIDGAATGWTPYVEAGAQVLQSEHPDGLVQALHDGTIPTRTP